MNYRKLLFFALRFMAYALVLAGLYFIFLYDARHNPGEVKITENSLTEIFQAVFVFLAVAGFFIAGRKARGMAPFMNLLALFFLMSFIREFNNQIDFWFYIVLPFLILFGILIVINFKKNISSFLVFIEQKSSGAFFIGFLVTYLFSRLFGKTSFWMALMGDAYHRTAKNMAEEGIELLGYAIILISMVELLVSIFGKMKQQG